MVGYESVGVFSWEEDMDKERTRAGGRQE